MSGSMTTQQTLKCGRRGVRLMRAVSIFVTVALGTLSWALPADARECALDPVSFQSDFEAYLGDIYELADQVERQGLPEGISLREFAGEAEVAARALTAEQEDALCRFFSSYTSIRQAPRSLSSSLQRLPVSYDLGAAGRARARMASETGKGCLAEQGRAAVDLVNKTADLAGIVGQAICDAAPSGDLVVINTVLCPIAGVLKVTAKVAEFVGKVDDICQLFKQAFNLNQIEKKTDEGFLTMELRFDGVDSELGTLARQVSVDSLASQVDDVDSVVSDLDQELDLVRADLDEQGDDRREFQDLNLRISIEQQLGSEANDRISLFQLPASVGGKLEEVREVVAGAILMNDDAGQDIGLALTYFAQADAHFNNQQYSDAFASYRQAYREAAQAREMPNPSLKR